MALSNLPLWKREEKPKPQIRKEKKLRAQEKGRRLIERTEINTFRQYTKGVRRPSSVSRIVGPNGEDKRSGLRIIPRLATSRTNGILKEPLPKRSRRKLNKEVGY